MKIQSKFKDYYDYVGQQFGEDPQTVYIRNKVDPKRLTFIKRRDLQTHETLVNSFKFFNVRHDTATNTDWKVIYIVAGAYIFPMAFGTKETYHPSTQETSVSNVYANLDESFYQWISSYTITHPRTGRIRSYGTARSYQQFREALEKPDFKAKVRTMIVELDTPVFLLRETGVDKRVPVLADYGIPSLVSPTEMWQNIYTTLTNALRNDPDKDPPVTLANNQRIEKAGFDLKTSFRNPINKKVKK